MTRSKGALVLVVALSGLLRAQPDKAALPEAPQSQKANGLELTVTLLSGEVSKPAVAVEPRERFVTVRAAATKFSPPAKDAKGDAAYLDVKLVRTEWFVATIGNDEVRHAENPKDDTNSEITVGLPEPGETVLVIANALVTDGTKTWITPHAQVLVSVNRPAPPAGAAAQQPKAPAAVPAGVSGLHVIVVADGAAAELKALAESKALADYLKASNSRLYVTARDGPLGRRPDVARLLTAARGPVVIVLSADGKRVLPAGAALPLNLTSLGGREDAAAVSNWQAVADAVGRAAGGR